MANKSATETRATTTRSKVCSPGPRNGAVAPRSTSKVHIESLLDKFEQSIGRRPAYPRDVGDTGDSVSATVAPGLYALDHSPGRAEYRMVDVGVRDYTVGCVLQMFDESNTTLVSYLADANRDRVFLVMDPMVKQTYGTACRRYFEFHGLDHVILNLPSEDNNELNKDVRVWTELLVNLTRHRPTKHDVIVAFGGGVTHDVVGFVAATLRRGIPYWAIPTTLAAQIDAALSPKTAVDVEGFKNAAGVMYPAEYVLYDPTVLATLDRSSLLTGIAELVKLAIVRSEPLFDILESNGPILLDRRFQNPTGHQVIDGAIRLFLQMKWEHPFPGNSPASLRSFGHGFSRELESLSRFSLTHGEAVSVEMAVAACLSNQASVLRDGDLVRLLSLLTHLGLPVWCQTCDAESLWPVFTRRFERGEDFYFPIPAEAIGSGTFLERFSSGQFERAIYTCRSHQQRNQVAA